MDRNKGNNWFSKLIAEVETKICDANHKRGEKVVRTNDVWRYCNTVIYNNYLHAHPSPPPHPLPLLLLLIDCCPGAPFVHGPCRTSL